jgi:hypothetical protein
MTNSDAESLDQNSKQEWYKDGLRFSCSQCGNCCTGGPGAVWYTADEGRAMAVALGLTDEEFTAKYTRAIADRRSLNESETQPTWPSALRGLYSKTCTVQNMAILA